MEKACTISQVLGEACLIRLKRVYEKHGPHDGMRFLVERLWPRGVRKAEIHMDGWQRDAAPSDRLRKWFAHDPAKWTRFQKEYFAELDERPEGWQPILEAAMRGNVTLLYSSHDTEHNNAAALQSYLKAKLEHKTARGR